MRFVKKKKKKNMCEYLKISSLFSELNYSDCDYL